MSLDALRALVDDLVRDKDQVISSVARDLAITQAVLRYSADRPREVVVDQVSLGGTELDLPSGWEPTLSQLRAAEYPIDQVPPSEFSLGDIRFRNRPAGMKLALPIDIPAGAFVRLTYTRPHVVDAGTDTVPDAHRLAVASFAASLLCGELASYYATESAPTIAADTADHQGKTERFRARARDLANAYVNQLGINEKRPTVAGTVVHLQGTDSHGRDRLYHARRYR